MEKNDNVKSVNPEIIDLVNRGVIYDNNPNRDWVLIKTQQCFTGTVQSIEEEEDADGKKRL